MKNEIDALELLDALIEGDITSGPVILRSFPVMENGNNTLYTRFVFKALENLGIPGREKYFEFEKNPINFLNEA